VPKQLYIKAINQAVIIEDSPFASGGEGELFKVLNPSGLSNCVAKVFHRNKRDAEKEAKIEYLLKNPPVFEGVLDEQPIVWVKHILHDAQGNFVGFMMPKATGEKLEILTSPKLPKYLGKEWNRFKMGGDEALRLRLKVCYNLAAALRMVHATGKYVLVDLKPDNILIKSNGVVSIVDTDSIEVIENGKTLFPATVATPEYTPNEYYTGTKPGQIVIDPSWDNFSLAVIYYRLLFGVHPHAATSKAPYDNVNALGDKIKHGLFVHNPNLSDQFTVVPPPHRAFAHLDRDLRKLFLRTFVNGHEDPNLRPSPEEWGQTLTNTPLLLTNRPLPSKSLDLNKINESNWFVLALEKAMKEQNVSLPNLPKLKKHTPVVSHSLDTVLKDAKTNYKKVGQALGQIFKYTIQVLIVVFILFLAATVMTGSPLSDVSYALSSVVELAFAIPNFILDLGGVGLVFLLLLMPFLAASFPKFSALAKDKVEEIRKKLIGRFSFTEGLKQKSLEELQYTLYNQRTKVKQRLREVRNELIVWSRVKVDKEKKFFRKNTSKILASNRAISSQLGNEKKGIQAQDDKAKDLMKAEANALKQARLDYTKIIENHPVYSNLAGKTVTQKIAFLNQRLTAINAPNALDENLDIPATIQELKQLEVDLKGDLENIKHIYDEKHAVLLEDTSAYKIKIDDLVKESVDTMRETTEMDSNLMDDNFKKLLKSIQKLQIEIQDKEGELSEINQEIKGLKDELKLYK
jgi:serine/threonine protein kinase